MGMWDEEDENTEFRDIPEETGLDENGQPRSAPPVNVQQPARAPAPQPNQAQFNGATQRFEEPKLDEDDVDFLNSAVEEKAEEEDFTEILNDANLRIEQGKLYQMIMNHDLFDGMDADARAVKNVQQEIRKFARERMEIMLGMRQEQVHVPASTASPFNALEIDILKRVASQASGGATERPEANEIAEAVREVPKRKTLNPIGGSTGLKRTATPAPTPKQAQKPLQSKPAAPIKRTKQDQIIDQILAEEGLTRSDLELEYVGIGKKLHELTAEELSQRQKAAQERLSKKKTVKSESALPMATPEQQELLALQRATQFKGVAKLDGLPIPGGMSALLDKVKSMPIKNPQ